MDSRRSRSRLLLWAVPILLITAFVASASADGLFGSGLSGLPFLGGSYRGYCRPSAECDAPTCPPGVELDVGYLWGHRGMTFDFDAQNGAPLVSMLGTISGTLWRVYKLGFRSRLR